MDKSPEAFRTISEVAEWLDVPTHVLRFWESRFSQVKPVKRAGGRRYYRPSDMLLIGGIKKLLHDDGMTIRGVQKLLREEGARHVAGYSQALEHGRAADDDVIEGDAVEVAEAPAEVPPPAAGESEVVRLVRASAEAAEEPEPEPEAETEPEPLAGAAHDGGDAEDDSEMADETHAPRFTFGSVRGREPTLPFDSQDEAAAAAMAGNVPVAGTASGGQALPDPAETPAPEAEAPDADGTVVPLAEAAAPRPTIPPTPEVPEIDPEDGAPTHDTGAGAVARLVARDRRVPLPSDIRIEAVVEALRRARGGDPN